MSEKIELREDFRLAKCCKPSPGDAVLGFLKTVSGIFSVHKKGCAHLNSIRKDRLVDLSWDDMLKTDGEIESGKDPIFKELDKIDISILRHHAQLGVDYAAVVAKSTGIERAIVFERHKKLRDLKLLARVQPKMIQYRKNIVDNKWIKHRNHTYYDITDKGRGVLNKIDFK